MMEAVVIMVVVVVAAAAAVVVVVEVVAVVILVTAAPAADKQYKGHLSMLVGSPVEHHWLRQSLDVQLLCECTGIIIMK